MNTTNTTTDTNFLQIGNNGENITTSNYWGSPIEKGGKFFVSVNADAYRLLWPRNRISILKEMKTAKEVVISFGWSSEFAKDTVEILFDDHSESPFVLFTCREGIDRYSVPQSLMKKKFSVWVADFSGHPVCKLRRPCYIRKVDKVPCLQPI